MSSPKKRIKVDENAEMEAATKKDRDSLKHTNIDMEAIKQRIEKTLQNNSNLSQKFANLKENLNEVSSYKKVGDIEISKRNDNEHEPMKFRSKVGLLY